MEEDVKVLARANTAMQEALESEVVPDPMDGEQTWPTEEELRAAEGGYEEFLFSEGTDRQTCIDKQQTDRQANGKVEVHRCGQDSQVSGMDNIMECKTLLHYDSYNQWNCFSNRPYLQY